MANSVDRVRSQHDDVLWSFEAEGGEREAERRQDRPVTILRCLVAPSRRHPWSCDSAAQVVQLEEDVACRRGSRGESACCGRSKGGWSFRGRCHRMPSVRRVSNDGRGERCSHVAPPRLFAAPGTMRGRVDGRLSWSWEGSAAAVARAHAAFFRGLAHSRRRVHGRQPFTAQLVVAPARRRLPTRRLRRTAPRAGEESQPRAEKKPIRQVC